MSGPSSYSEWVILFEKFASGDDSVLEQLSMGNFQIDAGTASRFYTRVEDVYKKRKQNWLEKFQRSFQFQNFKTDEEFEIALRNGKQNFKPLSKFVSLKGLPEDIRKTLKKDLDDFVSEIKKSMKDNISKISGGREKMLILLNSFELYEVSEEKKSENIYYQSNENEMIPPTGRKIIF